MRVMLIDLFKEFLVSSSYQVVREAQHPAFPGRAVLAEMSGETRLVW